MIEKKDIEKLATLSRMKLDEGEKEIFAREIDSILGYVKMIQEVTDESAISSAKTSDQYPHRNSLRDDVDNRDLLDDTSKLIDLSPASHDGYIKVKKILN